MLLLLFQVDTRRLHGRVQLMMEKERQVKKAKIVTAEFIHVICGFDSMQASEANAVFFLCQGEATWG